MAKESRSISFKNSCIDFENMRVTETSKDYTEEFSLRKILQEWDGIEGISFTLKKDSDLSPIDEDGDED